ncbi:MAG: TrkA C-terminal domain-containing protein [Candidatus Thermoplasmatota archaeon]|nr:TrkA C-terminal domain-containing protein [Candidatus Thermoplasmatota archaeon]
MKSWEREELEEIEYEPTSVREILTQMKDVAELIVDLAYSAIIFDDEEIAEEVRYLEAHMDTLNYHIRLSAMLAARTTEDAEQLSGILQVASATEEISNAAGDIIDLLDLVETRPFLPRLLARSVEKIKLFKVPDGSALDTNSLSELNVESDTGMRVIAVRRGERWGFAPTGSTVIRKGDTLLLRGTDDGFEHFVRLSRGETHPDA